MAINKVNTTAEEQSFKFLKNQSSILHTIDTNRVTVNGVNVIVDKPKRGDVMCITRYKENGVLLDANKQKVIWIDGLSIEPTQLSQEYEPVGICFAVNDNKALVRYREERKFFFTAAKRYELQYSSIMNDGAEHTLGVTLEGDTEEFENTIVFTPTDTISRQAFVNKLNAWFFENASNNSAELVELDTDLPAVDTSDIKDGDSYRNRVVVSIYPGSLVSSFMRGYGIEGINVTPVTAKKTKTVQWYYKNNGFVNSGVYDGYQVRFYSGIMGGCCRAMYYDYINTNQASPTESITSINSVISSNSFPHKFLPAKKVDFTDSEYCQLLRDTFASYDEYLDSMMVKYPCGAGGAIAEFPSGKENTYKLAGCTYLDNGTGKQEILYPAANWVASISLNAPNLGKGNWWIPSAAEMVQMMRDVTFNTSFWETEPDIVNRVIAKLTSISNSGWSMLSADTNRWTSSGSNYFLWDSEYGYNYSGTYGYLSNSPLINIYTVPAITIYEF